MQPVVRWYALGSLDHVPVVEDLAQVDAKINNLAAVIFVPLILKLQTEKKELRHNC